MYKAILIFSLFFFSLKASSQSGTTIKYVGIIKVDGVGSFPYQVTLNIDGTKISGNTITTTGMGIETKAGLNGETRQNAKQIVFSENKIIISDVKDKKTTFCFVNTVLTKKTRGKIETLEGSFTGKNEKSKQCATGQIYLARKSTIMADTINIGQALKKLGDTINKIEKIKIIALSTTEINKIICEGKKIQVRFYDGNNVDNDEIGIAYNGITIAEKYTLTKKGKTVDLAIEKDQSNIITINTLNIGTYGLNTVTIDITIASGQIKSYSFDAPANKTIKIQLSNY